MFADGNALNNNSVISVDLMAVVMSMLMQAEAGLICIPRTSIRT